MNVTMRDAFKQHHRLNTDERASLWSTCIFAFDTNVLLNIYRYADSTRVDLFKVLGSLGDRAWVPFQVAQEFYRRRIDIIQEQNNKYAELEKVFDDSMKELRGGGFRKSAFLKMEKIEAALQPAIEEAKKLVAAQREEHPDLIRDDVYLERLVSIIGTKIGSKPDSSKFDSDCVEAQKRIDAKQPPGYLDHKKPAPDRYGDVFIWKELIAKAKETSRPIVFITDDFKEDWWQIISGEKLGPRPELREEMRKEADVEFYIYSPAHLLQSAAKELNLHVSESSVDDATKVTEELQERERETFVAVAQQSADIDSFVGYPYIPRQNLNRLVHSAEKAVFNSLLDQYPNCRAHYSHQGVFDFIIEDISGRIAVEVKLFRSSGLNFKARVYEVFAKAYYEINKGTADKFRLYFVALNEESALAAANMLENMPPLKPSYPIHIGFISKDGAYIEVACQIWD